MMHIFTGIACVSFALMLSQTSCKKKYLDDNELPGKKPPIANAGANQVITLPTDSILLDGSSSSDPDGQIASYSWTKIAGSNSFSIMHASMVTTVVKNLIPGMYQFELKVTDSGGLIGKDTVTVNVNDLLPTEEIYITGCGTLTTFNHLHTAGVGNPILSAGSKIFFFSWLNASSSTNIYDTSTGNWSISSEHFSGIEIGTKLINPTSIYPGNGTIFEIYDAADNSRTTYTVPESRAFIQHDITGEKLIFAGGFYPDYTVPGASKRIDIYDGVTNSWSLVNYDSARRGMTVVAIGNKIFFAGGYFGIRLDTLVCNADDDGICNWIHPGYPLAKMDVFDMSSQSWSTRTLSEAQGNIITAKVDNKLLFFHSGSPKIDIYDASTDSWAVEQKNDQSYWNRAHTVGNKVLLVGRDRVGIFDLNNKSWSINQMSRASMQSDYLVAIAGDKILFFYVFDHENRSTAIDTYNASTNTWCHGELSRSLIRSGIGVVGNKIYIAGGITKTISQGSYDQYLDNIWIFNFR